MTDLNTAQMVTDLRETDAAVRANGWVAPGLGVPGAPLGLLSSLGTPLSGLAAAGLSWFMPLVSFLDEPLKQLQGGNPSSVMSGAQDFGSAGGDIARVAGDYRASTSAQTSDWSGDAATRYRESGAVHAEGVEGLGEASNTVASSIIGAAQVVAQAIAEITELIAQAVAQIVPILTQAIARAGETFGQSVVEAIPPCVGIAVEYALRIAAKLAALVASGDNLLKLVKGGMAVVELLRTAMDSISRTSVATEASGEDAAARPGGGAASAPVPDTPVVAGDTSPSAASSSGGGGGDASGSPASAPGGYGGGSVPSGLSAPVGTSGTTTSGLTPPPPGAAPDVSRAAGHTGGGAAPTAGGFGGGYGGGVPAGAGAARAGHARGGALQGGSQQQAVRTPFGGAVPGAVPAGGMPMGGGLMGGARPAGGADADHQRRYPLVEQRHDEVFDLGRVLPEDVEQEVPAAEPVAENPDDVYFTNPPEITRS
ncbi:hypothetical protein BLA60_29615 [Actinophytocola xinjiangensis]|uniref:PPE family protein n=1 Tax=Actinophytocola xinjiangensis TaxID=485602 RepID=A0A7Z0WIN2_9PSEU|nr:hypothetical protein [Actinophytocola xinjiangensis]OLF07014.1 hypothetical protein BLA60_29615 [Actinophytocola xinjiangensis]